MNMRYAPLLLIPLLALSGCDQMKSAMNAGKTAGSTPAATASADTSEVVATVNGSPIHKSVLDVYSSQRMAKGVEDSNPETMLNELVTLELMRQEADSKGLGTEPVVIASLDQMTRSTLAGAAIKDFMDKNPVSDEDAKAYYDENLATPTKEYKARHILVENEDDAKLVISMLDTGMDFSELAKEKSKDTSASSGGDLGWFNPSQMVKEFADATAALEKGKYTKTPVKTQFGWHVIMLDDIRDSTPPAFDEVKDRLKMGLANQKLQKHLAELREKAKVEIVQK